MTPEQFDLPDALREWLRAPTERPVGWAPEPPLDELRCHPDLSKRLTEAARPVRGTVRAWVDGCPVVHHRAGPAIAFACGTGYLAVRSGEPAGALAPRVCARGLDDGWVELDPWAPDITFVKTKELLRRHVQRAYDRAEGGTFG